MAVDLFHLTRVRDAEKVAREGLRGSADSPSKKMARWDAGEDEYAPGPMAEEPADVKADRALAEALTDAQYAVDGARQYPHHDKGAVYFWATESRAHSADRATNWTAVIVAVDRNALPNGCRPVRGNVELSTAIWSEYYDAFRGHGSVDDEEVRQWSVDYWRDVTWYEGHANPETEVWVDCDVPPDAIEYIKDTESGKVIYEPADASQAVLQDFAQG